MTVKPAPQTRMLREGLQLVSIGVSATRRGISDMQKDIFRKILEGKTGEFHHGDCVGGDAQLHDIVKKEFHDKFKIIVHPPMNSTYRAYKAGDKVLPEKAYHDRNMDIVEACNVFLGFPKDTAVKGGTWFTINFFRELIEREFGTSRPPRVGDIIMPNGDIGHILVSKHKNIKLHS